MSQCWIVEYGSWKVCVRDWRLAKHEPVARSSRAKFPNKTLWMTVVLQQAITRGGVGAAGDEGEERDEQQQWGRVVVVVAAMRFTR